MRPTLALLAAFVCQVVSNGFCNNFGVFVKSIQEEFKSDKSQTVLIGAITEGSFSLAGKNKMVNDVSF